MSKAPTAGLENISGYYRLKNGCEAILLTSQNASLSLGLTARDSWSVKESDPVWEPGAILTGPVLRVLLLAGYYKRNYSSFKERPDTL